MQAALKGWVDKALLPGFAFTTDQVPKSLLGHIQGATIFATTGMLDDYHRSEYSNALEWILGKDTPKFCGIDPVEWLNY